MRKGCAPGFLPHECRAAGSHRLVNYHRRGYGQSSPVAPPFSVEEQSQDLIALLNCLQIEKAHLVGHSFGADIALQAAVDFPERVQSLALLEPPLPFLMSPESGQFMAGVIGQAMSLFAGGDRRGTLDTWLDGAFGPGWQQVVNRALPGGYDQAVKDVETAIIVEGGALQSWTFGPQHFRAVQAPVLSIFHVDRNWKGFQEVHEGLVGLLSQAETLVVPNVTHLMQIQNPTVVAEGIATFLSRNSS
jgi:3-oxoadipate enol-lactonase